MIGVAVPAHNEEAVLGACLAALREAAAHPALRGEAVMPLVVLDACTDGGARVVQAAGVDAIVVEARNVGAARRAGAAALLARGARWLAFTDADSRVADDWLAAQLALGADAVCGCVTVDDWSLYDADVRRRYDAHYRHADGHRHVHGANLGVSASAYRRAGGFRPLRSSEDVRLVRDLERTGARIAWSAKPRVVTSSRREGRADGGFADFLGGLERDEETANIEFQWAQVEAFPPCSAVFTEVAGTTWRQPCISVSHHISLPQQVQQGNSYGENWLPVPAKTSE